MEQEIRVAVYGATGYTGIELIKILLRHPKVKIVALTSHSHAGKNIAEVFPFFEESLGNLVLTQDVEEEYDLAFLCLPHENSLELVPKLLNQGKKVIDLSGAYRVKRPEIYPEYYGFEHGYPDILKKAVYGLPEIYRKLIKDAQLIANPGCYPTSVLLALYPLLKEKIKVEKVVVTSLSGVSGAGRKPVQHFHFPEMFGDFFAYSLHKHRHVPEMEAVIQEIGGVSIFLRFSPVVVPVSRGMLSSISIFCEKVEPKELYTEVYKDEKFVKIVSEPPHIKYVLGTNLCLIHPIWDSRSNCLQVISVIDNLGKGASSQAVQNFNIMMGLEEDIALDSMPNFP